MTSSVAVSNHTTPAKLRTESKVLPVESWDVERRHDGAVLVRVHSHVIGGRALPDAVFAFRAGDPQFSFWEEQLRHRQVLTVSMPAPSSPLPPAMNGGQF